MRRHVILLPAAAFLVTLPLLLQRCSCGHDFGFHLQSWLEAATQFRHGNVLLHWAFTPAFHAGEPRFLFYPPLSWTLGGLLTLILPFTYVPAAYTFLVLLAAGFSMRRLLRNFTTPDTALLGAALYIANPYMIFNAFERTAYAELLAAVWLPLLLLGALRKRPTILGIALPVALLWLTNAPAAVMGCYTLAVIVLVRLALCRKKPGPGTSDQIRLALTTSAGAALGLSLAGVYLIPAAYERRYVQIAMAVIHNMRVEDNFLFGHTGDVPHDRVLHTASLLALSLLAVTALALGIRLWRRRAVLASSPVEASLTTLTLLIALLLTPFSMPLWSHLPELAFLQFPWRLLSVLEVVMILAIAIVLKRFSVRPVILSPLTVALAAALALPAQRLFWQACDRTELPAAQALSFRTGHGVAATDEYTPADADNDTLRSNDPAFWLAAEPTAFAPGTLPNPALTIPNYDIPPTPQQTLSQTAPQHLQLHTTRSQFLILNLRDFPSWRVTVTPLHGPPQQPAHTQRDDGLVAIALPAGDLSVDLRWQRSLDQQLGLLSTTLAGALAALLAWRSRSRRIEA